MYQGASRVAEAEGLSFWFEVGRFARRIYQIGGVAESGERDGNRKVVQ
jgi:hypothetical protein